MEQFDDGTQVGLEQLLRAGLVLGVASKVKILGDGDLTKKLQVAAHKFSKSAEQKIADCGGTATKISLEVKPIKRKQKQKA